MSIALKGRQKAIYICRTRRTAESFDLPSDVAGAISLKSQVVRRIRSRAAVVDKGLDCSIQGRSLLMLLVGQCPRADEQPSQQAQVSAAPLARPFPSPLNRLYLPRSYATYALCVASSGLEASAFRMRVHAQYTQSGLRQSTRRSRHIYRPPPCAHHFAWRVFVARTAAPRA